MPTVEEQSSSGTPANAKKSRVALELQLMQSYDGYTSMSVVVVYTLRSACTQEVRAKTKCELYFYTN